MTVRPRIVSAQAAATAQLATSATGFKYRLRGIWFVGGATAGTLTFKDGGASGATMLVINTPGITTSGATAGAYIPLPAEGMLFDTDIYCAVATAAFVTIFFEQVAGA